MYKWWTQEEEQWLISNYESLGVVRCAEYLNKSQPAILHKVVKLNIANRRGGNRKPRVYNYGGYECVSTINGRYYTHRKVMEDYIGRELTSDEVVHHKNGNTLDNRIENLELVSRSSHQKVSHKEDLERRRDKRSGRFMSYPKGGECK